MKNGYDSVLFYSDGEIMGDIAFQEYKNKEGTDGHVFSFNIIEEKRGNKHAEQLMKEFIEYVRDIGVRRFRMSDKHQLGIMATLKISEDEVDLGVKVDLEKWWIYLSPTKL
ncbi:MAG: GNAT family N-acetyltransferase [archaeon]